MRDVTVGRIQLELHGLAHAQPEPTGARYVTLTLARSLRHHAQSATRSALVHGDIEAAWRASANAQAMPGQRATVRDRTARNRQIRIRVRQERHLALAKARHQFAYALGRARGVKQAAIEQQRVYARLVARRVPLQKLHDVPGNSRIALIWQAKREQPGAR